jgi:hypothetical protein
MYVKRNFEARSFNHCCNGKAISIIFSQCVSVALVSHYAMCMRRIDTRSLLGSAIFFDIIS